MKTVQEIFDITMALIDEVLTNGNISTSDTIDYSSKTPYIIDMLQHELMENSSNIEEYANLDETTLNKWTKFVLPTDLKSIKEIFFINSDSQIKAIEYKRFGNSDIYFYFTESGTVRMLYMPIPTKITALTDELQIDDITATTALPNGLAWHLMAQEGNKELAKMFADRYREAKFESIVKMPLSPEQIIDVYGGGS